MIDFIRVISQKIIEHIHSFIFAQLIREHWPAKFIYLFKMSMNPLESEAFRQNVSYVNLLLLQCGRTHWATT